MHVPAASKAANPVKSASQRTADRAFSRLFAALVVGLIAMATFAVVSSGEGPTTQPLMSEAMPSGD